MSFIITPIKRLETLHALHLDQPRLQSYLDNSDGKFFYMVSRETEDPAATLHARMFFYNGEDPATGSAAGCCTAWAVRHGVLASDTLGAIEQGIEMRRPSRILIRATRVGEAVNNVRVGGSVVALMRGELTLG
jgi:trans-2,3-dihydro-3-hydroxyanthranilate isomerase